MSASSMPRPILLLTDRSAAAPSARRGTVVHGSGDAPDSNVFNGDASLISVMRSCTSPASPASSAYVREHAPPPATANSCRLKRRYRSRRRTSSPHRLQMLHAFVEKADVNARRGPTSISTWRPALADAPTKPGLPTSDSKNDLDDRSDGRAGSLSSHFNRFWPAHERIGGCSDSNLSEEYIELCMNHKARYVSH